MVALTKRSSMKATSLVIMDPAHRGAALATASTAGAAAGLRESCASSLSYPLATLLLMSVGIEGPGRAPRQKHPALLLALAGRPVRALENVTRPHVGFEITASAADRLSWRCLVCSGEWEARASHVAAKGTGCPHCARPSRQPLAEILAALNIELVRNTRHPDRSLANLHSRSADRCLWACVSCGHQWPSRVSRMVDEGGCKPCARRGRVPAVSAACVRPDLLREFRENLTSGRALTHVTRSSSDFCRWVCAACGHQWTASVASRVRLNAGCRPCGTSRTRNKLMVPLSTAAPLLAAEFRRSLTDASRTAATTASSTSERVEWQCLLGHRWETTVRQRYMMGTGCPNCAGAQRRSRFELEVGHLITAATGLLVVYDHPVRSSISSRTVRVDLYLPHIDLLIDLDPAFWHRSAAHHKRDVNKCRHLEGRRALRVRPPQLPPVSGTTVTVADDGNDSRLWAAAVCHVLQSEYRVTVRELDDQAVAHARGDAATAWLTLVGSPPDPSLASAYPQVAVEFVANLVRPTLKPALMPPASNDLCLWRCGSCRHEWSTVAGHRTVSGTGCPRCALTISGRSKARATTDRSLAVVRPDIAALFLANVTNPGYGPETLHVSSGDRCRWECATCDKVREIRVADAVRTPGCAACGHTRIGEARIATAAAKGRVLSISHPELAEQIDVERTGRTPDRIPTAGRDSVWWRCPANPSHTWRAAPYSRTSKRPTGCPQCARRARGLRES